MLLLGVAVQNSGHVGKAQQPSAPPPLLTEQQGFFLFFFFQKWPLGSAVCTWDVMWHGEEVQGTSWKHL